MRKKDVKLESESALPKSDSGLLATEYLVVSVM